MKLPTLNEIPLRDKRVLLRLDTDLPVEDGKIIDEYRLKASIPTLEFLQEQKAEIIILGHRGHPKEEKKEDLSLRPVANALSELVNYEIPVINEWLDGGFEDRKIVMLENLRFDIHEEENDPEFAKKLAQLGEVYINESFADSHREHASIIGLPLLLPHAAGLHLIEEVVHLSRVFDNPRRPVVIIVGGAKEEKTQYIPAFENSADWILVGGLLPRFISPSLKVKVAQLIPSGRDITSAAAREFAAVVEKAGTIVWNGPLGMYEKEEYRAGTEIVARALVESDAYKVVGGGDTVAALTTLKILSTIEWVSTGGGAMLEFLANGDLPGLKALRNG
ncbi:phosphoglycerate kinase [Candidatus Microgenomates bacterium]|nr:phosphoglycerate kinase [Candidatus Microgenomates bacterium]